MAKKHPSISGSMVWNLLERLGTQGASLIVSIILARLLAPSAYGILSLVTVFVNLATVVVETGFGSSIIQKKEIQKQEIDIIFTFNLTVSLALFSVLFFSAPLIASFYNNYDHALLSSVIRAYALILPIGAITSIQSSMIYRNMQFKKFFVVNLLAIIGSSIVGITAALLDAGVWALVLQQLTAKGFLLLTQLFAVSWKPRLNFRFARAKALFRFGSNILINRLVNMLYNQMSSLVIGKYFTSEQLAFYSKGHTFPNLIAVNTDYALQKVMFSAYSKAQDDRNQVREMMRKTIRLSTFVLSPMMFGMLACSENFVLAVLTDKWLKCVPYMQIFCVVCFLQPISTTASQALNGLGMSGLNLRLGVFTKCFGILIILCISLMGLDVPYIALGVLLTTLITATVSATASKKVLGYRFRDQLKDIGGNMLSAISMAAVCFGVAFLCRSLSPLLGLILQILAGAVWYLSIAIIFKNDNLTYLLGKVKSLLKK